ncbi:uncharacterized protein LAESUDRAFT_743576 [Laetiporus sulphureus 93-53]|uniref:Calcofluor white hypersensitive protein n=1 Tax=Laetiporus sulphureus 93-53 TaxID=1314785 RepID=A0A165E2K0_9APHY|nr:uncharacterized protein LAESUDRAFT_743576 [Laetiporus sulphureus 93-53]KZT06123.1 hypothetical protein LAESUDRAFT_743576 [Laetiporus sulphureus 93-53]
MSSRPEAGRPARVLLDAFYIARAHTILAYAAFLGALFIGCALHYKKIVKNGIAGYPEEWFPSVSATIGDWYPERNVFQILIALNSGPRLALVLMQYYLHRNSNSWLPGLVMVAGVIRTLSCGGWVYITSTDDHDAHDVLMIGYIVLNLPWMFGSIANTPAQYTHALRRRRQMATAFFVAMIPMIYFFIQHKVHRIPGAYTKYSFFEWGLIFFDVMFDSAVELEVKAANLQIAMGVSLDRSPEPNDIVPAQTADALAARVTSVSSEVEKVTQVITRADSSEAAVVSPAGSSLDQLRSSANFLSDLYLSFIYWSIFTSLTPTFFYFSVWELAIAGHELSLLSVLSPVLLGVRPFQRWCRTRAGRTALHVLSLVGLGAYKLESPLHRLFAVAFATMVVNVGAAVDWTDTTDKGVGYHSMLMGLGFLLSSIAKHANHSNNPVWPIVNEQSGGYNKTGLLLAVLAICNYAIRASTPPKAKTPAVQSTHESTGSWLRNAISLGTLIFTLHCLIADPSTLIAWSWTGYPIKGPVPHLHGSLTHVAQALGLCLPLLLPSLSNPLWFACGCASAYALYALSDWPGYAGGLGFAVFLMSITPGVLQRTARTGHVAKTYFVAWFVVIVFYFASVFTVAYAFVPGGVYFRERTDLVLLAQMAGIALAFDWSRGKVSASRVSVTRPVRSASFAALSLLCMLSLLVTMYRWPMAVVQPHRPGSRLVRAGIWTVHFGIDNEGRDSQRRMRDLIRDMELDVVGLLETDLHRTVFGNRDLTRVMVEELGFYVDIGPGPNKHTWGAVLLSKFPIINSTHHLLPSPDGELAPAIEAVLDMYGTPVTVVVAHNGQEETPLDRELQAIELARIMSKSYPDPVLYLGYVVTQPLAQRPAPYEIMVTDGRVHDIDETDWDRWCEYIFYRGLYRTAYARVSRSTITDTEMQIGQFVVPRPESGAIVDDHDSRYLRTWKEELPPDHWFPMEYYHETGGVRGHFYHVFDTPLYYKLPEGVAL